MTDVGSSDVFMRATEAAKSIRAVLGNHLHHPRMAIICGSGLGGLQLTIDAASRVDIAYSNIPHLPASTVPGHEGKMVFGLVGSGDKSIPIVMLVGRVHFYEGHAMQHVTFATRVCSVLGVATMVVTNAAGGLNPEYSVGDIVVLHDHLNLAGLAGIHPLRGPNVDEFGVRFPPLSNAYSLHLRRIAYNAWRKLGLDQGKRRLYEGCYAFVSGPTYETRAECRMLRMLGADVVGMSTVPEIITARHCSIQVLAFSIVTNKVVLEAGPSGNDPAIEGLDELQLSAYLSKGEANHEEVLYAGREAAIVMQELVKQIIIDVDVR